MRNKKNQARYGSALTIVGTGLLFFSKSFINADSANTLTSDKATLILVLSVFGIFSLTVGLMTLIFAFANKE